MDASSLSPSPVANPASTVDGHTPPYGSDHIDRWKVYGPSEGISDGVRGIFGKSVSKIVSVTSAGALYFFHPDQQIPLLRDRLNSFSGGEECASACRVLAEFTHQYVKHIFQYPPHLTHDNPHWTAVISRDDGGNYSLRGAGIFVMLENNERKLHDGIEATLLNGIGGLCERTRILAVDGSSIHFDQDFLLNRSTRMLSIAANHFRRLNETFQQYGSRAGSDVIRADFGKELHRGLSCDARLNLAERRQFALKRCFVDLSKKLMAIALPDGKTDIVTAVGSQGVTYNLLCETVIPNVLLELTEQLVNRRTINTILLNALDAHHAPAEPASHTTDEIDLGRAPVYSDRKQQLLNKTCAKLATQIVSFLAPTPGTILGYTPRLSESVGRSIAIAIRDLLENVRLDQIINKAIEAGLPSLHSGQWQVVAGRKVFVPGETLENGTFIPAEELSFTFPRNAFDLRRKREFEEVEDETLERKVIELLDHTINSKIKAIGPGIASALISPIQQLRDVIVEEFFPGKLGTVFRGFERVLGFLIGTVIGTALYIACYPLTRLGGILADRYSRQKAEEIIYLMHMDIHHNLAYKWLDEIVDALKIPQ